MNNFFTKPSTVSNIEEHQTFVAKYRPYFINDFHTNEQFKKVLHS